MKSIKHYRTTEILPIIFLVLIDALIAYVVVKGMVSPSISQTATCILANALFIIWLVIVSHRKTASAIGILATMSMIIGVTIGLDYFATIMMETTKLQFFAALGFRVIFAVLAAISTLLFLRKLSVQQKKVQNFLWIPFSIGIGLYISAISISGLGGILLALGLTILVFGTIFQIRKQIGKALILAIWILLLIELVGGHFWVGFPTLSTSLKELIASIPSYTYLALFFPALYWLLPKIWKMILNSKRRIANGWKLFSESLMGKAGLCIVLGIALMGVFAPYIAPYPYYELNLKEMTQPPSWKHPLGTDHYGEDLLSRVMWGSRVSLLVGFAAASLSMIMGTLVGMISGYYGGAPDSILMRITDIFLSVPTLPLMLIFAALFGKGLFNIILVLSILGWTGTARMVRSETLSLKEQPLTEAAKAIGATDIRILGGHVLPNVLPLILANMVLSIVNAILGEAWVSFLGFGVSPTDPPSWGIILYWADLKLAVINNYWWWIIPPGLLLMLLVLGFAFMSHALDQVMNPRLRRRRA
jgi:ABC-type dipeptide/oligopeptide/nickel transport system permease subunit